MHLTALYWLNNKINSATENIRQPQSLTMQRWPCILFLGVSPDPVYKHRDKGQFLLYSGSYITWPCVCVWCVGVINRFVNTQYLWAPITGVLTLCAQYPTSILPELTQLGMKPVWKWYKLVPSKLSTIYK